MFPFRSLPPSFRFASSFPCVTSVLSFHVLYSVRYFFPFVSTLRVVSTLRFRSLRLSFRFTFSLLCVTSVRSFQVLYPVRFFFPFVSTLRSCFLYLVPFVLNSPLPFATFFPSFQRFHPVHLPLPFMSMRSCRYFLPFFKSYMRFVYLFLFSKSFISLPPSL